MWFMYFIYAGTLGLFSTCILSAAEELNCTNCIIVNQGTGDDQPLCLKPTSPVPCKTLSYVFSHAALTNTEVVLQGDHSLNHTLNISNVHGLIIRTNGRANATILCRLPTTSDTGSGLVFESVTNLTIIQGRRKVN